MWMTHQNYQLTISNVLANANATNIEAFIWSFMWLWVLIVNVLYYKLGSLYGVSWTKYVTVLLSWLIIIPAPVTYRVL